MITVKKLNTVDEYNNFINHEGTINVCKLSAEWCGPCRVLAGIIEKIDSTKIGNALLGEVDVDNEEFDNVCTELSIRGVPVLAYFKDGKLLDKTTGLVSEADIINKLSELK